MTPGPEGPRLIRLVGGSASAALLAEDAELGDAIAFDPGSDDAALEHALDGPGVRLVLAGHSRLSDPRLPGLLHNRLPGSGELLLLSAHPGQGAVTRHDAPAWPFAIAGTGPFPLPAALPEEPIAALHALLFAALAEGRPVRHFAISALHDEPPPDRDQIAACAIAARRAFGHAPLAWTERLAEAAGPGLAARLSALRHAEAALNGAAPALAGLAADDLPPAERAARSLLACTPPPVAERLELPAGEPPPGFEIVVHGPVNTLVRPDPDWARGALARGGERLLAARAERRRDTCVIVGNGPSLRRSNLALLDRADVFIANYAFLDPVLRRHATCLSVVNALVAEQEYERLNLLDGPLKVFPIWLAHCMREEAGATFVAARGDPPRFVADLLDGPCWSASVSFFNLQLAYWFGYRRALLIGFDHSYAQPPAVAEGDILVQVGDDPNHFDPRYFRNKRWQAADVDRMGSVFGLAREAWEADGRVVLNCTPGGALDVFARSTLEAELLPSGGAPRGGEGWADVSAAWPLEEATYRHVSLVVRGLRIGPRHWAHFACRLQMVDGQPVLELRQNDAMPEAFATWPEDGPSDQWGPYRRIPLYAPEPAAAVAGEFAGELGTADAAALRHILRLLPRWLDEANGADAPHLAPWREIRSRIAEACEAAGR